MKLYYRHRENGVTVFRMEVANRQRRIELNQVATITRHGEIVPHKRRTPTPEELTEVQQWWDNWQVRRDAGDLDEAEEFITELNLFADWAARKADAAQIDKQSDALLTALLDLRQVIVRRLSEDDGDPDDSPDT